MALYQLMVSILGCNGRMTSDGNKGIHMTDEYAAHYFLQQGYLSARVEFIQAEREKENNGD